MWTYTFHCSWSSTIIPFRLPSYGKSLPPPSFILLTSAVFCSPSYFSLALTSCWNRNLSSGLTSSIAEVLFSKGVRKGGLSPPLSLIFYKNFIIRQVYRAWFFTKIRGVCVEEYAYYVNKLRLKTWIWRQIVTSQQRTPNTNDHPVPLNEPPPWKFSAYATAVLCYGAWSLSQPKYSLIFFCFFCNFSAILISCCFFFIPFL